MKLCMVISSLSSGGAERAATAMANHWSQRGWKITVVTLASEERDFYAVLPDVKRITLQRAGKSRGMISGLWNNGLRVVALRQVLHQEQPNITLSFMPSSNILSGMACMGTGLVAVGCEQIHPPRLPLNRPWEALRRLVYPRLAAVSALTEESADWIRTHTGAASVSVIPNPVPYPLPDGEPTLAPQTVKNQLGGMHYLLAVGRLAHQKGFDRLLSTFAHLHSSYPEWRLVILGEGPLRKDLERQREELDLSKAVALPGAVSNIGDWYEASEAYVMTSRFEGFGNTLAEALAYGLPAVAVDCETGPRDIVRHNVDGLLVPEDDPDALVAALDQLMGDEMLRNRLASRATEARDRFAVSRVAAQWEALFQRVV